MAANPEVLAYLIEGARRRGIPENLVVKAFGHEGLNVFDPNKPDRGGDEGSSFGPYQLHYGGMSKSMPNKGMGDDFTRATGLDARNPSTWRAQTDFVLDHLAKGGSWDPWMGAKAEGITGRMGLPGGNQQNVMPRRPGQQASGTGAGTVSTTPIAPGTGFVPRRPGQQVSGVGAGAQSTAPTTTLPPPLYTQPDNTNSNYFPPAPTATASKDWRNTLADSLAGGAQAYGSAIGNMALPQYPSMTAQSVSLPVAPIIDPQSAQAQRQGMAQAIARLNAGQLYG